MEEATQKSDTRSNGEYVRMTPNPNIHNPGTVLSKQKVPFQISPADKVLSTPPRLQIPPESSNDPNHQLQQEDWPALVPVLPEHDLNFSALATKFSSALPQRILVTRSVYVDGESEDALLAQDDLYDIHFVHRRITATFDSPSGKYYVPINSTLKFGIVYEGPPVFPQVKDIIESANRPKLVCAQKTCLGTTPNRMVCTGEILAVIDAETESVTTVNGVACLNMYSFTCKKNKHLPYFCAGNFTTAPSDVQLPLMDILEKVRDPFPSAIIPFYPEPQASSASDFSPQFYAQTYRMVELGENFAIIASPRLPEANSQEFEVPVDTNVMIKFVRLSKDSMAVLKKETHKVIELYDESRIDHLWRTSNNERNRNQSQLFRNVQDRTVDIAYPDCSEDEEEATAHTSIAKRNPRSYITREVELLKEMCRKHGKELKLLREHVSSMQSQIATLSGATSAVPSHKIVPTSFTVEENVTYLRSFTEQQVLQLLKHLRLEQYCDVFASEKINGEILAEMNDDILKTELGISSKLHRIRLLVVILGHQRAET